MLADGEVDLYEVLDNGSDLVEYDISLNEVETVASGKHPCLWQWTLQDATGRIWTELVDDE